MTNKKPQVSPNIYGIETEYSCMITLPDQVVHEIVGDCHSVDAKLGLYVQPQHKGTQNLSSNVMDSVLSEMGIFRNGLGMLSNGARFYIDPSGPEYATAETRTAEEAVLRSFDGDHIMLGLFSGLRDLEVVEGYQFNRRIVDHNRTSRGVHLNNTTSLDIEPDDQVIQHLAALNVAKGALFGSGGLLLDEKGRTQFHHSPRLSLTNELSAHYATYSLRPLVRTPFKSDGSLSRIETVTSDALSFAWPLRASMVATNALTKMLELGITDLPILRNPARAATVVGQHGNNNRVSLITRGGTYEGVRPVEILKEICTRALELDEELEFLDDESDQVLEEIIQTGDEIIEDQFSVADRVESVARLVAFQRKMDKDGVSLDSEKMCKFDYYWDLIGEGLADRLRDKGIGWYGFSSRDIGSKALKRHVTPPSGTRAFLRGNEIKKRPNEDNSQWSDIDFNGLVRHIHPLRTHL